MLYEDKFGFLPEPISLRFAHGRIVPVSDYASVKKDVEAAAHKNGYLFPPEISRQRAMPESYDPTTGGYAKWEAVPNTKRPSPVQFLPVSHELTVHGLNASEGREGIGSFIIHLVAFVYGVRLQFHDWRIDGRALTKGRSPFHASPHSAEQFIDSAINTRNGLPQELRVKMTNILYLYSMALSQEYEWLEFTLLYMVFDACYNIAEEHHSIRAQTHEERFEKVASFFNVVKEKQEFKEWVRLRNDLFHEALWDGRTPGTSTFSKAYSHILYFRGFECRVIAALLGHKSKFITDSWKHMAMSYFD